MLNADIGSCTHTFIRTSGLPYKYFLHQHIITDPNWKLDPHNNFHTHWGYMIKAINTTATAAPPALFQIRDPDVRPKRRTRRSNMPESLTQRGLTQAEVEDIRLAKQRR